MNITDHVNISAFQKSNTTVFDDTTTNSSMVSAIVFVVPGPIVLCTHFLALTLLKRDHTFRGSQRYLIDTLCCTEIVLTIQLMLRGASYYYKNIMLDVAILFGESAGGIMYFTVMTFLTLDRFAEVKLNLKYPVYCTTKKTITMLFLAFIISLLLFVGLLIYLVDENNDWYNWHKFLFSYLVTIIAFITYIYIFKKLRKNRLALKKMINQLNKNQTRDRQFKKTQRNPKIFLPSLIILTFILFAIIPHYVYLGFINWSLKKGATILLLHLITVLYFLGWCVDPVNYIFSIKSIQQNIRRRISSLK